MRDSGNAHWWRAPVDFEWLFKIFTAPAIVRRELLCAGSMRSVLPCIAETVPSRGNFENVSEFEYPRAGAQAG